MAMTLGVPRSSYGDPRSVRIEVSATFISTDTFLESQQER